MKCSINIGFYWDNTNETLVDWEKRYPCPNDATHEYHTDMVSELTKPKLAHVVIPLCDDHCQVFKKFLGKVKKIDEAQDHHTTQSG